MARNLMYFGSEPDTAEARTSPEELIHISTELAVLIAGYGIGISSPGANPAGRVARRPPTVQSPVSDTNWPDAITRSPIRSTFPSMLGRQAKPEAVENVCCVRSVDASRGASRVSRPVTSDAWCWCAAGGNSAGGSVRSAHSWLCDDGGNSTGLSSTFPHVIVSGNCASANSSSEPSKPASRAYSYAVFPVGPATVDASPLSPLSPRGIVSASACSGDVPVIAADACEPAGPVVTDPMRRTFGGPGTFESSP